LIVLIRQLGSTFNNFLSHLLLLSGQLFSSCSHSLSSTISIFSHLIINCRQLEVYLVVFLVIDCCYLVIYLVFVVIDCHQQVVYLVILIINCRQLVVYLIGFIRWFL